MKVLVLGAGLVGGPMARDLAADGRFDVAVADISNKALENIGGGASIEKIKRDLSVSNDLKELVSGFDMVASAVPGFMGYDTLETIIQAGKDVVDIAFFAEDPFQLDDLAKERDVVAVMDCGVAPGMSNILIGHADHQLDETVRCEIYVGGLPFKREWPYEYKAVFSPVDVIEEYTRPARYVENGALVTRPALSDPEYIDFPGIGTLEAFNSDGLRTLARTIEAPNMKEKTLRYPGHIDKMAVLRKTGFFEKEPVEIAGTSIRPIDFTAKLLFPMWEMSEGDEDLTVMKIIVEGFKEERKLKYIYNLFDRFDRESGVHSMARTTGYTATVALRMIAEGLYDRKGMSPPEYIGKSSKCVDFMMEGLRKRGVFYEEKIEIMG